jgi:HlyD family type I secretion membrane fusion protein
MTDAAVSPPLSPTPPAAGLAGELSALAGEAAVKRLIGLGSAIIAGFFVCLGGWAATAHLDSAATSYGVIEAEGDHKVLEHPDGGVVSAILVKEGELVRQGQVLVRLDPLQASAELAIESTSVDTLTATVARLQAEQAGAAKVAYPPQLTARAADPAVAQIIDAQNQLFSARHAALGGQGGVLGEQISQARSLAEGYRGQIAAIDQQSAMIQDELAGLKKLYASGYATKTQVLSVERAAAALTGQKKEYESNVARLGYNQAELAVQQAQLRRDRLSTVSDQLQDAEAKLADAQQRRAAAQAVLDRTVIRAPVDGYVFGLAANTIGGVVARGERIVEILPKNAAPIAEAHIKPSDGARVSRGMKVNVRVMSAQARSTPMLHGVVESRSVDLLSDAKTGAPFYKLIVAVNRDDITRSGVSLDVGTPVQVIVPTGSRTALYFFFQPLMESLGHGFKEL